MSVSYTTRRIARNFAAALTLATGLASLGANAAGAQSPAGETYDWSANLISFDADTGTAVLQARIDSFADIAGLDEFEDGDRLTLVWTGRHWAAGVRDLLRNAEAPEQALTLPVEFVATERDDQYVSFRIPVPAASADIVAAFEPGTRVTGVSPVTPADRGSAIVSLRHYNDVR